MGSVSNPNFDTISTSPSINSISDPATNTISTPYPNLINEALVNLNETGIQTSGPNVTGWFNSGIGGDDYNLTTIVGAASNLTHDTQLGHTVVASSGGAGLETTSGQSIPSPYTVFVIARYSDASPSANQQIMDSRDAASPERAIILSDNSSSDQFSIFQGSTIINLNQPYDTNPRLFTGQFNGDATTTLRVSGLGSVSGNAGSGNWDYGTLFSARTLGNTLVGYIANLLVFDRQLNEVEVTEIQAYLTTEYGL